MSSDEVGTMTGERCDALVKGASTDDKDTIHDIGPNLNPTEIDENNSHIVFIYKDPVNADKFNKIKDKFIQNLKINPAVAITNEGDAGIRFPYYGSEFTFQIYLMDSTQHFSLMLHCLGKKETEKYEYYRRKIKTIHGYICKKTRETLEETIKTVLNECPIEYYHCKNNELFTKYKPSEGEVSPPACLEQWFLSGLSVKTSRASRLLFLDGGGVKGVIEATTLMLIGYSVYLQSKTESETLRDFIQKGKFCCDYNQILGYPQIHELFDQIVGTSSGALIACGLARNGYTPIKIIKNFIDHSKKIFPNRLLHRFFYRKSNSKFKMILEKEFKTTPRRYPVYGVVSQKENKLSTKGIEAELFDSRYNECSRMEQAVLASASAPTYLPHQEIESVRYVDGGVGSNCPIKEGMKMTQQIAELQGEEYKGTECTISLGCGLKKRKRLPTSDFNWDRKIRGITTNAQKNWDDYPNKGENAFRLNPSKNFKIGKYSLDNSKNGKKMTIRYLNGLLEGDSKDTKENPSTNKLLVEELKIDGKLIEIEKEKKTYEECETVNVVKITFDKKIEKYNQNSKNNESEILIDETIKINITYNNRPISFVHCFQKVFEIHFKGESAYKDRMQLTITDNEVRIVEFEVKVTCKKAYYNEIENVATCLFAKNIYVHESNNNDILPLQKSTVDDCDSVKLEFKFVLLSGHECKIQNIEDEQSNEHDEQNAENEPNNGNGINEPNSENEPNEPNGRNDENEPNEPNGRNGENEPNEPNGRNGENEPNEPNVRNGENEPNGENEQKNDRKLKNFEINCEECKAKEKREASQIKEQIHVKKLTMSTEGDLLRILDKTLSEDKMYTITIEANRWLRKGDFKVHFYYMGFEISGSPITLAVSAQQKVLQRFYRTLDHSTIKDNFRLESSIGSVPTGSDQLEPIEDLKNYAEEKKWTIILVTQHTAFVEHYIRYSEHVIKPTSNSEKTIYLSEENVTIGESAREKLQWKRKEDKPRYRFLYGGFLESLNHIEEFKDETPDDLMRKMNETYGKLEKGLKLFFNFPDCADNDSIAEADLILLAQTYNVKIVLMTFDHRKQEFYIRHRHHVIVPRPEAYFFPLGEVKQKLETNTQTLHGVVFVKKNDIQNWENEEVLHRYYRDTLDTDNKTEPPYEMLPKNRLPNDLTEETFSTFRTGNNIVILSMDENYNEYFIRKDSDKHTDSDSAQPTTEKIYCLLETKNKEVVDRIRSYNPAANQSIPSRSKQIGLHIEDYNQQLRLLMEDIEDPLMGFEDEKITNIYGRYDKGCDEETLFDRKLVWLSHKFSVKTVVQSYSQERNEYFIKHPWHVIRPWTEELKGTIFIRDKGRK